VALEPLQAGDPSRIGRFRLTARLGAGGMGVVYLGEAKNCGQVAVKVVRPEVGDDQEFRARFRREVALLTRVQGLCTVRVIEAETESASPFLVTEYASGPSLSEHIRSGGPLGPDMLYGLATGLAEALVAIHAAGVVHRDLKPSNVLLTQEGPKVIDFGISQALDGTVLTETGITMGSPGFMAPEQVIGKPGQPADVFAWGLTVAYAASARQPFGTGPTEVLMFRILHDSPDIAAVPADLRPVVEAAVSKDPAARPAARDLLSWLTAGVPDAQARTQAGQHDMASTQLVLSRTWRPPAAPASASPASGRPSRRRPLAILAGAAALAAVIGAGTAYAIGSAGHAGATPGATGSGEADAATALPTVTFGSYTGRKPTAIVLNSSVGGGTVQGIHWTSWTAAGAAGKGTLGKVPTTVTLSNPVHERFTRIGETSNGEQTVQSYSDGDWPTGASPAAAVVACTKVTPAALTTAWRAASPSVQQGWAAPGSVTTFAEIQCWKDWVVAYAIGNGDGTFVFSQSGGLHVIPETDLQKFSDTVCPDPAAPAAWKTGTGPAVC
jgi:predicted Ser/Thr protein kinase